MATYYSPSSNMAIGTNGDIYTEGGQLGKMAFVDNLTADLVQNGVDFLGEYFYRYAIETVGTNLNFTFSLIDNPIKPGYTVYIRNTGDEPISIREGSSNTLLRTIAPNATVLFTAYQSGSPDIWYSYDVFFESGIPLNYIYIDGTFGDDSTGLVDRIDFPFQTLNAGITAANATLSNNVFFIRPGNYIYDNTSSPTRGYGYYFAPDTYITFSSVVTAFDFSGSSIYGDANFTGPVTMFDSTSNCVLECNSINNITVEFGVIVRCNIREVIDCDVDGTVGTSSSASLCNIGRCIDSDITFNGRAIHHVLIDYFEKNTTNGRIYLNPIGVAFMDVFITVKNMNILQFATNTIDVGDSRGTITVENLVCVDDTGFIINSDSGYAINFILGNVNIVNRLFTTRSVDDYLFVNYLVANNSNLPTIQTTSGNTTTIEFNYMYINGTLGTPVLDFGAETNLYGNYLHCNGGYISVVFGTIVFDINELVLTGSTEPYGIRKFTVGNFIYRGNIVRSDGIERVFLIDGGTNFIDIAHITAPIDVDARIFEVDYDNDTDVCNINFGIAEIGPYLLNLVRGVCNITGYYVQGTGAASGLIRVASATLNADIKFAEHTNAYILTYFRSAGVPVNISSHVDECVSNNGSIISLGSTIGYGSLLFGGRYVAAGTNIPITMATNGNYTMRLERASLVSAGGAAAASVQYTSFGTLTIENHGETAAQAPFNATVGSIVSVGTLNIAAYT